MFFLTNWLIKMNNYINEKYVLVWKHPESTPSDWNTYLLEENHYNKIAREVNRKDVIVIG